ncbi:hypothetical protein G9A89_018568 [Geosiphon pyriformis]|nr:hypothetical protein G9A89_018568 [Geosiphon pyriformis]
MSGSANEITQTFVWNFSKMSGDSLTFERLPLEVLQHIFILSGNHHFCLVSKTFHQLATSQSSVKTQWLMHKYNYDHKLVLYRGLKWRFFNKDILSQLDSLYYQEQIKSGVVKPENVIPFDIKRVIPYRFFATPDCDGKAHEIVKTLLKRGASPDEPEGYPLLKSVALGQTHMVKLLLSAKAKVDMKDNLAIVISAKNNNLELAKLLIEHGAQPNAKALKESTSKQFRDMTNLLLDNGASPNAEVLAAFNRR